MDNWFWLYLITRLDAVHGLGVFAVVAIILGGGFVCLGLAVAADMHDLDPKHRNRAFAMWKRGLLFGVIPLAIILTLLPSKRDLFFILGGSALIEVAQTDQAGRIAGKSVEAVEQWLDEQIGADEPASIDNEEREG